MSKTKTRKIVSSRLGRRVATYAATAAAVTAGGLNMAEADIVDSAAVVTVGTIGPGTDFDVDGDGTNDFNISVASSFGGVNGGGVSTFFVISGLGSNLMGLNTGTNTTYNGVNQYLAGFTSSFATVGGSNTFGAGQATESAAVMFIRYPGVGGISYGVGGVFGLQFNVGGQTHFGGAVLDGIVGNDHTFNFQWENVAGRAYGAGGAIPEPSSLGLLALGAFGLVTRRRKTK